MSGRAPIRSISSCSVAPTALPRCDGCVPEPIAQRPQRSDQRPLHRRVAVGRRATVPARSREADRKAGCRLGASGTDLPGTSRPAAHAVGAQTLTAAQRPDIVGGMAPQRRPERGHASPTTMPGAVRPGPASRRAVRGRRPTPGSPVVRCRPGPLREHPQPAAGSRAGVAAGAPSTELVGVPGAIRPSRPSSRRSAKCRARLGASPRPVTYSASMSDGSPGRSRSAARPIRLASSKSSHHRRSSRDRGRAGRRAAGRGRWSAWSQAPAPPPPRASHTWSSSGNRAIRGSAGSAYCAAPSHLAERGTRHAGRRPRQPAPTTPPCVAPASDVLAEQVHLAVGDCAGREPVNHGSSGITRSDSRPSRNRVSMRSGSSTPNGTFGSAIRLVPGRSRSPRMSTRTGLANEADCPVGRACRDRRRRWRSDSRPAAPRTRARTSRSDPGRSR